MALQGYLTSGTLSTPTVLDKESGKAASRKGYVSSNLREGEIFLKNDQGKAFRLVWSKSVRGRRALSPGRYSLVGFRLTQGEWMLSSTSDGRNTVVVRGGKTTPLEIDSTIKLKLRARRHRGKTLLMMGITTRSHKGLSIYHKGRRIPIPYRVIDSRGQRTADGLMRYG